MNTIKVTVSNGFFHGIIEEFYCSNIDTSDLQEMEYCAEECCGQYLELHGDLICAMTPDVNFETIAQACTYLIEEVVE